MLKMAAAGVTALCAGILCATPHSLRVTPQGSVSLSLDSASAVIGHPLTPMSVAGVHRRAERRAYRRQFFGGAYSGNYGYGTYQPYAYGYGAGYGMYQPYSSSDGYGMYQPYSSSGGYGIWNNPWYQSPNLYGYAPGYGYQRPYRYGPMPYRWRY
jgi:hypothetical protein